VLFENPNPGRAVTPSGFFGELGLSGAISSSLCCVVSRVAIILKMVSNVSQNDFENPYASPLAGQIRANAQ
jgi:hypothetical protein